MLKMIAAVSTDGFLTDALGRIPWQVPADVQHFRRTVAGKTVLCGRKTAEQMLGWFEEMRRDWQPVRPIVLSRKALRTGFPPETRWAATLETALDGLRGEVYVIGGGQIYAQCISHAEELILSEMQVEIGAGVRFPEILESRWRLVSQERFPAVVPQYPAMHLCRWRRIPDPSKANSTSPTNQTLP